MLGSCGNGSDMPGPVVRRVVGAAERRRTLFQQGESSVIILEPADVRTEDGALG